MIYFHPEINPNFRHLKEGPISRGLSAPSDPEPESPAPSFLMKGFAHAESD